MARCLSGCCRSCCFYVSPRCGVARIQVDYLGRAVAALAADPQVLEKSGKVVAVGDLAAEYGFTDVDGRLIPAFRLPE